MVAKVFLDRNNSSNIFVVNSLTLKRVGGSIWSVTEKLQVCLSMYDLLVDTRRYFISTIKQTDYLIMVINW